MIELQFSYRHSYASKSSASVPITLRLGKESANVLGYVDTGASSCLFQRSAGEMLGLTIEDGEPMMFHSPTGSAKAFGHIVQIEFRDLTFESLVYFFADDSIEKNLLGRTGWLDRIRLGIVDYDRELYLAPYDYSHRK
jgi:hypothetical protein